MNTRILNILFVLFLPFAGQGQVTLIVREEIHTSGPISNQDPKLIHIESRIDRDRKVCSYFIDTVSRVHYIFLGKELKSGDSLVYYPMDTIRISDIREEHLIVIGSNESQENLPTEKRLGFVIAIEQTKGPEFPDKSILILKVWSNGVGEDKFQELKPSEIIRYNLGFYKK